MGRGVDVSGKCGDEKPKGEDVNFIQLKKTQLAFLSPQCCLFIATTFEDQFFKPTFILPH
jgi:hypothetical protein